MSTSPASEGRVYRIKHVINLEVTSVEPLDDGQLADIAHAFVLVSRKGIVEHKDLSWPVKVRTLYGESEV